MDYFLHIHHPQITHKGIDSINYRYQHSIPHPLLEHDISSSGNPSRALQSDDVLKSRPYPVYTKTGRLQSRLSIKAGGSRLENKTYTFVGQSPISHRPCQECLWVLHVEFSVEGSLWSSLVQFNNMKASPLAFLLPFWPIPVWVGVPLRLVKFSLQ